MSEIVSGPDDHVEKEISEECEKQLKRLRDFTDDEEKFRKLPDNGLDLEKVFPERYCGELGKEKVYVQIHGVNSEARPRRIKSEGGELIDVVARVWVTDLSRTPPAALCYDLTPDGGWYSSSSRTHTDNATSGLPKHKGLDVWTLGDPRKIDSAEIDLNLLDKLGHTVNSKVKAK